MKINREDIQIIARHSNWSEKSIDKILEQEVYKDTIEWKTFLRLFFISLGACFTTAGIIFFFAYNWGDLHKFIKIGLVEGLVIITTLISLVPRIRLDIRNIILTAASILVGVLFAVFGQIYQTGANAYDFFLDWTMYVTLWVFIASFAPLWLLYLVLINTTIVLFAQQLAHGWSEIFVCSLLFTVNTIFLICSLFGPELIGKLKPPTWFTNLIALAAVIISTVGISIGILDGYEVSFVVLIIITSIMYGFGIIYGLKTRNGFYLSIISFSLIVIVSVALLNFSSGSSMFFVLSLWVVSSVTVVIKTLLEFQKKWKDE